MTAQEELFPKSAAAPPAGEAERALTVTVAWALEQGKLMEEDAPLVAAATLHARALDTCMLAPNAKTIYAMAQALPPYMDALAALRLPAAIAPAPAAKLPAPPPAPDAGGSLRDLFGMPGT